MEKDYHSECACCNPPKEPIWPVDNIEQWVMEICEAEARSEESDRNARQHLLDKAKTAELIEKHRKDIEQKRRDQKADRMRTINERRRLGLLQINYGGNTIMARKAKSETVVTETKERTLTKTELLDSLISANLEAAGEEGAKERIVAEVAAAFPDEDVKRLGGLFFSRRAVIRKAARTAETATA